MKQKISRWNHLSIFFFGLSSGVACQAKRKKVTRKTQKTALIYPIYGNQSGFSYVI